MKVILLLLFIIFNGSFANYKQLRCLVCRATIKEMTAEIGKVNPKKQIQVGGYRLDGTGKLEEKLVPFARSGMHLSELMDEICEKINDYARATYKTTGELTVLKLIDENGKMNPKIQEVNLIQDADLNKSLHFYCEGIVEEFEDEIFNELKEPSADPINAICTKATNLCDSTDKDEL